MLQPATRGRRYALVSLLGGRYVVHLHIRSKSWQVVLGLCRHGYTTHYTVEVIRQSRFVWVHTCLCTQMEISEKLLTVKDPVKTQERTRSRSCGAAEVRLRLRTCRQGASAPFFRLSPRRATFLGYFQPRDQIHSSAASGK